MPSDLSKIGCLSGTDKATFHQYTDFYDAVLQSKRNAHPLLVVEMGVGTGSSLMMWSEYFPNARIVGLDIADKQKLKLDFAETYVCDAEKESDLESVLKRQSLTQIDIFVDDGGHTMQQQQVTLKTLLPHMRSGGLYILEDLHTSYFSS